LIYWPVTLYANIDDCRLHYWYSWLRQPLAGWPLLYYDIIDNIFADAFFRAFIFDTLLPDILFVLLHTLILCYWLRYYIIISYLLLLLRLRHLFHYTHFDATILLGWCLIFAIVITGQYCFLATCHLFHCRFHWYWLLILMLSLPLLDIIALLLLIDIDIDITLIFMLLQYLHITLFHYFRFIYYMPLHHYRSYWLFSPCHDYCFIADFIRHTPCLILIDTLLFSCFLLLFRLLVSFYFIIILILFLPAITILIRFINIIIFACSWLWLLSLHIYYWYATLRLFSPLHYWLIDHLLLYCWCYWLHITIIFIRLLRYYSHTLAIDYWSFDNILAFFIFTLLFITHKIFITIALYLSATWLIPLIAITQIIATDAGHLLLIRSLFIHYFHY